MSKKYSLFPVHITFHYNSLAGQDKLKKDTGKKGESAFKLGKVWTLTKDTGENTMNAHRKIQPFNPTLSLPTVILSLACLLCAGCSSLLPVAKGRVESPWESFDQAKQAYDRIVPYQTGPEELQNLHFAPFLNPNIKIVTYLDLITRFMPSSSFQKEDLPEGIQDCIKNNNLCYGYELRISQIQSKRYGNVFLDLFNFKRETHKTGWDFNALIVIKDSQVIYKLWSGTPQINEFSCTKNPLGPLQGSESLVNSIGASLL